MHHPLCSKPWSGPPWLMEVNRGPASGSKNKAYMKSSPPKKKWVGFHPQFFPKQPKTLFSWLRCVFWFSKFGWYFRLARVDLSISGRNSAQKSPGPTPCFLLNGFIFRGGKELCPPPISPSKGKWSEPNLHEDMFQPSIFRLVFVETVQVGASEQWLNL